MKFSHGPMTRKMNQRFFDHPVAPLIVIGTALASLLLMAIYNI